MTSSNTLKKIVSIGAALLLAVGGSLSGAMPAQATPVTQIKSMSYQVAWLPGEAVDATFTSTRIGFSSQFEMDDVTAFRGQSITVASTNAGFPSGQSLADNVFITFYSSLANRTANSAIGNGTQVYSTNNSSVVVPANALAMRVQYSTAFNGDSTRTLAAGSYSSTPHVFHGGTEIPTTNASSGSNLYLTSSSASVEGATSAFTTPSAGTVRSTGYKVAGCFDMSLVTASTTYTARLKVNGTTMSSMVDYEVKAVGSYSSVYGASNSFSAGQLATWRTAGNQLTVLVNQNSNYSLNALSTQYDSTLELVDQSNTSLLKDCTPATPAGSGTLGASTTPGSLSFTPDATLGARSEWTVNIYKSSDNTFVKMAMGMGTNAADVMAPFGQNGPGSWTPGVSYYARPVASVTINGLTLESALGTASAGYTVPSAGGGSGNGNGNGSGICAGQTGVTSYAASSSTLSPGGSYTIVYNGNSALNGCVLPTQGFASARYLNGTLLGSFYYNGTSAGLSVSTYAFTFTQLQTLAGRPLVNGDVVTGKIWVHPGMTAPSQASAGDFSYTVTITGVSGGSSTDSTDVVDVAAAPLPVWASNIVSSIPTLTKSLVTTGGSVALTGGDYADLKSVTIGGKAVAFKLETTGNVTIPVPAGEAGKTADIVIVFAGGTMTVQDGIKYVAPLDVAKVAERPIAIAAGAKKITEAIADQIRHAAFANMNNDSISCVAYASGNTAAAKAAAKLTAVQACGIATKANPGLKASEITVIVDKAKAKRSAVGIKVFKKN